MIAFTKLEKEFLKNRGFTITKPFEAEYDVFFGFHTVVKDEEGEFSYYYDVYSNDDIERANHNRTEEGIEWKEIVEKFQ